MACQIRISRYEVMPHMHLPTSIFRIQWHWDQISTMHSFLRVMMMSNFFSFLNFFHSMQKWYLCNMHKCTPLPKMDFTFKICRSRCIFWELSFFTSWAKLRSLKITFFFMILLKSSDFNGFDHISSHDWYRGFCLTVYKLCFVLRELVIVTRSKYWHF